MKKTVVLGASSNPDRYSYEATVRLRAANHEAIPIGIRAGKIDGIDIITDRPLIEAVDTVTLYIGPQNQDEWESYILALKPRRVIFNPGTVNTELIDTLTKAGIETEVACTLVLLSLNAY
jgi:predicted CoA-binding protein